MKAKFFLNLGRTAGVIMGAGFVLTASAGTPSTALASLSDMDRSPTTSSRW